MSDSVPRLSFPLHRHVPRCHQGRAHTNGIGNGIGWVADPNGPVAAWRTAAAGIPKIGSMDPRARVGTPPARSQIPPRPVVS